MDKIIKVLDGIISSFILLTILIMIFFAVVHGGYTVIDLWSHVHDQELPFELMILIIDTLIFVKVYRILAAYLISHHIQIKLLLQIAIIASMMDVVFMHNKDIWQNVILAVFAVAILIIYSIFGGRLNEYEDKSDR